MIEPSKVDMLIFDVITTFGKLIDLRKTLVKRNLWSELDHKFPLLLFNVTNC